MPDAAQVETDDSLLQGCLSYGPDVGYVGGVVGGAQAAADVMAPDMALYGTAEVLSEGVATPLIEPLAVATGIKGALTYELVEPYAAHHTEQRWDELCGKMDEAGRGLQNLDHKINDWWGKLTEPLTSPTWSPDLVSNPDTGSDHHQSLFEALGSGFQSIVASIPFLPDSFGHPDAFANADGFGHPDAFGNPPAFGGFESYASDGGGGGGGGSPDFGPSPDFGGGGGHDGGSSGPDMGASI